MSATLRPDSQVIPALLKSATQAYHQGALQEVEKLLKQALALEAGNVQALYMLGSLYYQQRRYVDALDHLTQALLLQPQEQRFRLIVVQCLKFITFSRFIPHYAKAV